MALSIRFIRKMSRAITVLSLVPFLALSATPVDPGSETPGSEIRILARLKRASDLVPAPGKPRCYYRFGAPELDSLGRRYACKSINRMCPWDKTERTLIIRLPKGGASSQALVAAYRATGRFELVELDGIGYGHGVSGAAATPNDADFNLQWGLHNQGMATFGTIRSKAGADIKAVEAWDVAQGSAGVLVAVLDCGLNIAHPDIAARVYVNAKEIPGNHIDDDGNGFVDDVNGWAFANDSAVEGIPGTPRVLDDYGHGTNVAGIIGAIGGNGIGFAGVDRHCRIMPVKVLNAKNWGYYSWFAAGIRYAVDNGAQVINMSLGGANGNVMVMQEAVAYALKKNVTVVASMGNERSSVPEFPAAFPGVIAVGATGPDDNYARSFEWDTAKGGNFGPHMSVCAPGEFIYGLHYQDAANYDTYWSGTSQAAPAVTAVCALLLAQSPGRTPAEVKRLIEISADDQVGDAGLDPPGIDAHYGHGRLNAYRAVLAGAAVTAIAANGLIARRSADPAGGYILPRDFLGRSRTRQAALGAAAAGGALARDPSGSHW